MAARARARRRDGDPGGDPSLGLQWRGLPRADVYDGRACCGTAARSRRRTICRRSRRGELRLQAFGVTEPTSGTDTTRIRTFARREGDHYVVNGQKIWISRAEHSDLMVLLCRTDAARRAAEADRRHERAAGRHARGGRERPDDPPDPHHAQPRHDRTVLRRPVPVPAENLIGEEGRGFRYILDGMNAERILIAAECIGDGRFFIDRATAYAKTREVFGRPIGQNQGVQFPIARAWIEIEAAALMVDKAARLFDAGEPCGTEANMAKLLASEASWRAADMCVQTHGGFGFAEEYDIERKFRETRLYQVAPISTNLILSHVATHVLGLPKSY